ncbi:MAG TPA: amino acid ABC transporter permease [Candidatus Agrococcus pullicola]|uniref:Amino acid ABC transporter permease n=1 Tax=Candidatus Agrococcus pullicola TaxID=2838429 RepID=A0A9D1YSL6_9MICO|nr:amino acid ABC transporter permease [Candidatus Agrococcus pullicola]
MSQSVVNTAADLAGLQHLPQVRPQRRGQWIGASAVAVVGLLLFYTIAVNENMRWDIVGQNLFTQGVLVGVVWTLVIAILSMIIAIVLGVVIALMRMSGNQLMQGAAKAYLWFFRGTPLLVQLIFWFNLALLFPELGLAMLFGPDAPGGIDTNQAINWFVAALLGFGLHEAAYMSEIIRSGFLSVDRGQREASDALGMTPGKTFRRILIPQAMRIVVPPTVNQFVNLLKATSLVAFIAGQDLLSAVQTIYARNFQVIPLLVVASIWYLVLVTVISVLQGYLERWLDRGYGHMSARKRYKGKAAKPILDALVESDDQTEVKGNAY